MENLVKKENIKGLRNENRNKPVWIQEKCINCGEFLFWCKNNRLSKSGNFKKLIMGSAFPQLAVLNNIDNEIEQILKSFKINYYYINIKNE